MKQLTREKKIEGIADHASEHMGKLEMLSNAHVLGSQFALGLPAILQRDVDATIAELRAEIEESAEIGNAMIAQLDAPIQ